MLYTVSIFIEYVRLKGEEHLGLLVKFQAIYNSWRHSFTSCKGNFMQLLLISCHVYTLTLMDARVKHGFKYYSKHTFFSTFFLHIISVTQVWLWALKPRLPVFKPIRRGSNTAFRRSMSWAAASMASVNFEWAEQVQDKLCQHDILNYPSICTFQLFQIGLISDCDGGIHVCIIECQVR